MPMVANAAIRASGDTKLPALIMTVGTITNMILDPLLIFGLWGFPRWELKGAAVATVLARVLILVSSLAILHFHKRMLDFRPPNLRAVLDSWRQVASLAIAASVTNIMPSFAIAFVTRLIAEHGVGAVAAWGAGSRVGHFVLIPVYGLGSGLVPFIGQNWGAERYDRVRTARRYAYRFAFLWGGAMVAILHLGADSIAVFFSDDAAVVARIVEYLRIVPLGFGMMGVFFMTEETLNAIGRPVMATATTAFHMFVLYAPLAYLGSHLWQMTGLFSGVAAADILAGFVGLATVHRLCHRRERGSAG
jgi:Na+-driven multidrug efflux pump